MQWSIAPVQFYFSTVSIASFFIFNWPCTDLRHMHVYPPLQSAHRLDRSSSYTLARISFRSLIYIGARKRYRPVCIYPAFDRCIYAAIIGFVDGLYINRCPCRLGPFSVDRPFRSLIYVGCRPICSFCAATVHLYIMTVSLSMVTKSACTFVYTATLYRLINKKTQTVSHVGLYSQRDEVLRDAGLYDI